MGSKLDPASLALSTSKSNLGRTAVAVIGIHAKLHSAGAGLTEAERLLATGATDDIEGWRGCLCSSGDFLRNLHWGAHG